MNGSKRMTNKEWLSTANDIEWWNIAQWIYDTIGRVSNDGCVAILKWLDEEHVEEGETS